MRLLAPDIWPDAFFVAKATIVLGAAWGVSFLLRRASAAMRHFVWGSALVVLLALPLASSLLPEGQGVEIPAFSHAVFSRSAPRTDAEPKVAIERGLLRGLWGVGAAAVLLRWGLAWGSVLRLKRRARRIDPERSALFEADLQRIKTQLGVRRPIALWMVDEGIVPLTWGLFRPVILLPSGASEWSSERRRLVLAHEVGHIARWDLVSQTAAQLALALVWFHPLTWLTVRREGAERERACDDLVLAGGALPSRYASELLAMAQRATRNTWAATAMARPTELEGRLLSILAPEQTRASLRLGRPRMVLALIAISVGVMALARVEPLVRETNLESGGASVARPSPDSPDEIDAPDAPDSVDAPELSPSIDGVDAPDASPPFERPLVSDSS